MQTYSEIAINHGLSQVQSAFLQKIDDCSPFASRLFLRDADLQADLLENLQIPYQLAQMQKFLANQTIFDENSLKTALRNSGNA